MTVYNSSCRLLLVRVPFESTRDTKKCLFVNLAAHGSVAIRELGAKTGQH